MSTIAEKLTAIHGGINDAKTTLAANLRGVGVAASDTETITQLAAKVADADEWHPNPYWPSMDDIADGEIGFIVRDRDYSGAPADVSFLVTTSAGGYSVDWGDGVTEALASGAVAYHQYVLDGGASDGHRVTTYKVKITATGTILSFQVQNYKNSYSVIKNTFLYGKYFASGTTTLSYAFRMCMYLQKIVFSTLNFCTNLTGVFYVCPELLEANFPPLPLVTAVASAMPYCGAIRRVVLPDLPNVLSLSSAFQSCSLLESVIIGSAPKCVSIAGLVYTNFNLKELILPENLGEQAVSVNMENAFYLTVAPFDAYFPNAKLSRFTSLGIVGSRGGCKSLTFHPSSPFSGTAPQIDISYCDFTRQSLVDLFNILPTLSGKQVKITGCTGAAELTAGDRAIATGKGWTVIQ